VLADFGWPDTVDIDGIDGSRELEAICIAWVKIGGIRGSWDQDFQPARRIATSTVERPIRPFLAGTSA